MKRLIIAAALAAAFSAPRAADAATTWQTIDKINEPVYYGLNAICFVANFPVASIMWLNKHVHTHVHAAALAEAQETPAAAPAAPAKVEAGKK